MARRVFFSFYYKDDSSRIQQVINMGVVEGQRVVSGQKWEEIKKGGDDAITKWIDDQMSGKSCAVVLVGAKTSTRPWVKYEIKKAWKDNLGVVGIRIHGLRDLNTQSTSAKGASPFDGLTLNDKPFGTIVNLYDPPGRDSKAVYASINDNIEKLVEDAIKIRAKY
jgi:Thoeris protein ThsB, TIR-like domain